MFNYLMTYMPNVVQKRKAEPFRFLPATVHLLPVLSRSTKIGSSTTFSGFS